MNLLNKQQPKSNVDVVKFADQLRKIVGWFKFWARKSANLIAISILSLTAYGCADIIRIINTIPIPEPPSVNTPIPTSFPTATPTVQPTRTPNVVFTPTPLPTATPVQVDCAGNEFLDVRDNKCKLKPILFLFKVQGYNPNRSYNCHNPEDGPRFYTGKVCVKDSTRIYCNPLNGSDCGPCDSDHPSYWNGFCHQRDYDDPRGPSANVVGAKEFWKDDGNPYYTNVEFIPGKPFTICIRPFADDKTADGIHLPIQGTASSCVTETYH